MAEIAFFKHKGDSTSVRGEIIGTKGSFEDNPARRRDAVFDEDLLTFFDAPEWGGCWVGMDFGKPVAMGRIDFVPRGDGNNIDKGDIYELCIWDNGDWKSLGGRRLPIWWVLNFQECRFPEFIFCAILQKGVRNVRSRMRMGIRSGGKNCD